MAEKELIDIKLLIHLTQNPTLCRVGIALLSAHFEGFIKQAANYYVVYVASQKLNYPSYVQTLLRFTQVRFLILALHQIRLQYTKKQSTIFLRITLLLIFKSDIHRNILLSKQSRIRHLSWLRIF